MQLTTLPIKHNLFSAYWGVFLPKIRAEKLDRTINVKRDHHKEKFPCNVADQISEDTRKEVTVKVQ